MTSGYRRRGLEAKLYGTIRGKMECKELSEVRCYIA
jgi:hypothetical protein